MENLNDKKKHSALGLENHLPTEGPGRDDMMQLYSWSFEEAWKAQEEWEKENGTPVDDYVADLLKEKTTLKKPARGPFFRWLGVQDLKELYELNKAGNQGAILEAFYICCINSLPLPYWCEMTFLKAYRTVKQYKAKSWDEVFNRPHKKGISLAAKRQEREKCFSVYQRIQQIKENDPLIPIDGTLFERIGKELGIGGKTLTEGYYYKVKKIMK